MYDWIFSPKMKNSFSESGQNLFRLKGLLLTVAFFQNLLLVIKCNFGWSRFITLNMMSERLIWRSWSSSLWKLHPCIKLCKKKLIKTSLNTRRCQRYHFWTWMYIYRHMVLCSCTKLIFFFILCSWVEKTNISTDKLLNWLLSCLNRTVIQTMLKYSPLPVHLHCSSSLLLSLLDPLQPWGCCGQWQNSVSFRSTFPFPPLWVW